MPQCGYCQIRPDHDVGGGIAEVASQGHRHRRLTAEIRCGHGRQHLPLRHLCPHPRRGGRRRPLPGLNPQAPPCSTPICTPLKPSSTLAQELPRALQPPGRAPRQHRCAAGHRRPAPARLPETRRPASGFALGLVPAGRPSRRPWRRPLPRQPASSRTQQPASFVRDRCPTAAVTVTLNRLEFGQGMRHRRWRWCWPRSSMPTGRKVQVPPRQQPIRPMPIRLYGMHLTGGSDTR